MTDGGRISEAARRRGAHPQYLRMVEQEERIPTVGYDRAGRIYIEDIIALLKAMGVRPRPSRLKRVEELSVYVP